MWKSFFSFNLFLIFYRLFCFVDDGHTAVGTVSSVATSFLIVSVIVGAGIYYLYSKQLITRKSNENSVAFENPSYLREVSMDNIQVRLF